MLLRSRAFDTLRDALHENEILDEIGLLLKSEEVKFVDEQRSKLSIGTGAIKEVFHESRRRRRDALEEGTASSLGEDLLTKLELVCNGENYTAWARRKRLLVRSLGDAGGNVARRRSLVSEEIAFVKLVLTKQLKSQCTWEHLSYVVREHELCNLKGETLEATVDAHLREICDRFNSVRPRMYFLWWFRSMLVDRIVSEARLMKECEELKSYLTRNVSDASAFHHLAKVVRVWVGGRGLDSDDYDSLVYVRTCVHHARAGLTYMERTASTIAVGLLSRRLSPRTAIAVA